MLPMISREEVDRIRVILTSEARGGRDTQALHPPRCDSRRSAKGCADS